MPGRNRNLIEPVDAERKIASHVAVDAAGPACHADQAQVVGHVTGDGAAVFESSHDGRRVPQQIGGAGDADHCGLDAVRDLIGHVRVDVEPDSAGLHE